MSRCVSLGSAVSLKAGLIGRHFDAISMSFVQTGQWVQPVQLIMYGKEHECGRSVSGLVLGNSQVFLKSSAEGGSWL